jgi:alpha-L-fucosidase
MTLAAPALPELAAARPPLDDTLNQNADIDWFLDGRFGLFVHFGLYAGAGRHEWVMSREKMTVEAYRKYFDHFDPDLFDARAWARTARAAGMRYAVLTTKHHEGFCLFDSQLTDYKITNTPFGRDLVREYVDACRAEGLRIGFYYSLVDWHHPGFTLDGNHPLRDDTAAREANAGRDMARYRAYLHGQVAELLTNYGTIDYMWFDYSYAHRDWGWSRGKGPGDWDSPAIVDLVHQLQPRILLNNRLDIPGGGVSTPEQYQPRAAPSAGGASPLRLVEECHTMNGSWGYDRDNLAWKSSEMLAKLLVDAVAKGNNLLLNVGPTGRGDFDPRSQERLADLGAWLQRHGRSIYGAGTAEWPAPSGCRFTRRADRLYLHLYSWPVGGIDLEGLAGRVAYAQFLHDGSEVLFSEPAPATGGSTSEAQPAGILRLRLPTVRPGVLLPVVEIFVK